MAGEYDVVSETPISSGEYDVVSEEPSRGALGRVSALSGTFAQVNPLTKKIKKLTPAQEKETSIGALQGLAGAGMGGFITAPLNIPSSLFNLGVRGAEIVEGKPEGTAPRAPYLPSSSDIASMMFDSKKKPASDVIKAGREFGGVLGEIAFGYGVPKLVGTIVSGGAKIISTALGRPLKAAEQTLISKVQDLGSARLNELSAEEKATLKSLADEQAAAEQKLAAETERKTIAEKTAAKAKGAEERAVGGLAGTRTAKEFGQYGIVPITKTKIGENLRTMVDNFVSSIKEVRKTKADAEFPAAFKTAAAREAAGESFVNSPGMKAVKKAIDDRLKTTTDRTLANNLEKLRDALFVGRTETSMTPTVGVRPTAMFPAEKTTKVVAAPTFKSAEDIRRFLGDAASGVTAEGYEAIGQNLARDFYGQLSEAMKSFSPEFGSYLQRYKDLSSQIESAGTKLGKALIGVEKDAPGYYAVDASKVADRAFSSPESISTLIDAMGGNKQPVMAMAERYFANEIAGKTTEQARKFLTSDKVRSLLDELGPEFRSRIEARYFTKASEQSKISEMAQSVAVESEQAIKDLTTKISDLSKNVETTKENIAKLKSEIDTGLERIRVSVSDADRTKNATDLLSSLKNALPPETYAEVENMVTQMKEASKRQSQARNILAGAATAIGLGYVAKTPLTNVLSGK